MTKSPVARLLIEVEYDTYPDTEELKTILDDLERRQGTVKKAELHIIKETKVDLR